MSFFNQAYFSGFLAVISSIALTPAAMAASVDRSGYDLFNPTPTDEMREFSTDRPDKTESPYTVDAGHYQVEADLANYTYDRYKKRGEDTRTQSWGLGLLNLKAGLTNSTDIQFVVNSYVYQASSDKNAGTRETLDGFGDTTVRLKYNLFGNDEGNTALAIMPFLKLPTNTNQIDNDDLEGGLILPYAIGLSDGYGLGLMTQVNVNKDETGGGYSPAFVNTATLGVDLTDQAGAYFEIATERNTDSREWIVTFDTGITYAVTDNLQLDAGINLGLTEAADNYNPFIGISYRY